MNTWDCWLKRDQLLEKVPHIKNLCLEKSHHKKKKKRKRWWVLLYPILFLFLIPHYFFHHVILTLIKASQNSLLINDRELWIEAHIEKSNSEFRLWFLFINKINHTYCMEWLWGPLSHGLQDSEYMWCLISSIDLLNPE